MDFIQNEIVERSHFQYVYSDQNAKKKSDKEFHKFTLVSINWSDQTTYVGDSHPNKIEFLLNLHTLTLTFCQWTTNESRSCTVN